MAQNPERNGTNEPGGILTLMASRDSYQIDGLTPLSSLDGNAQRGDWDSYFVRRVLCRTQQKLRTTFSSCLHTYGCHSPLLPGGSGEVAITSSSCPSCATTTSLWAHLLDDLWTHVPKGRLFWWLQISKYWVQKTSSANHTAWQS